MAGQNQDQFEVYFRRADLDGDGRISGAEAVAFFQGSGLSKQVLAQVRLNLVVTSVKCCNNSIYFAAVLSF
ncbi:hypothetical protein REPUB_Repub02eG0005000 [Reevesia pubescens]